MSSIFNQSKLLSKSLAIVSLVVSTALGNLATPLLENPLSLSLSLSRSGITATDNSLVASYSNIPLVFEPNLGQADNSVLFLNKSGNSSAYFTADEVVMLKALVNVKMKA